MTKLQLKGCWLKVRGNPQQTAILKVPEAEQQKVFQFLPFQSAGYFDADTGEVTAFFGGIERVEGEPFILKLDGTEATYGTRNQKGKRFPMGAPLSQYFTVTVVLRDDNKPVLYSLQFQTEPPLNAAGEPHFEPKRRTKIVPLIEEDELEEGLEA
jgi:hypothetical protein